MQATGVVWAVLAVGDSAAGALLVGDVEIGPILAQIASIVIKSIAEETLIADYLIDALIIEQISAQVAP